MAGVGPLLVALLFLYLMTFSHLHFTASKPTGFSLKLIPRDSPESPLYPGNLTQFERIQRFVKYSKARASYLESISTPNATLNPHSIHLPVTRNMLFYIVQLSIGVGNQSTPLFLLMDTGSGLVWTQCQPCHQCYNQTSPIYDSRASKTYRKLHCRHPLCHDPRSVFQCVNDECIYDVRYGTGSSTKGVASMETFKFSADKHTFKLVPFIVFGCSNNNRDFPEFKRNGKISGILGLSLSPVSLFKQLYSHINKRFSYCLVPFMQATPASSVLRFGKDIVIKEKDVHTTPFVKGFTHYHLNLRDISVGEHRMGFPPDTFKVRHGEIGGCFIDSGAVFTHINQNANGLNAYRDVMKAFENYFLPFKLVRFHNASIQLELCYEYPQDFHEFASMTFHFQGADFVVDPKYVYFIDDQERYFCVALLPRNGRTILGAWQQQNTRFIYDGNIFALQFVSENCAEDHL